MQTQRWAFTPSELRNPNGCKADDEFLTTCPYHRQAGQEQIAGGSKMFGPNLTMWRERGIMVKRTGESTNRYGDGTLGVSEEERALIADGEAAMYKPGTKEGVEFWKEVLVNEDGTFAGWAEIAQPVAS